MKNLIALILLGSLGFSGSAMAENCWEAAHNQSIAYVARHYPQAKNLIVAMPQPSGTRFYGVAVEFFLGGRVQDIYLDVFTKLNGRSCLAHARIAEDSGH